MASVLLLPILPVGLSLIAMQRVGALAFKSLGGGDGRWVAEHMDNGLMAKTADDVV